VVLLLKWRVLLKTPSEQAASEIGALEVLLFRNRRQHLKQELLKYCWSAPEVQVLKYSFWCFQKLSPVASDVVQKLSLVTNLVSVLTKSVSLLEEFVTTSCCIYTHSCVVNNIRFCDSVTQVWIKFHKSFSPSVFH